ncbi:unnamed protein product [Somion occarium]|uniref:FAD dependent oxidoreductase domain-containing protein n=1 Tax=Somion occarium TaxID=3059160 RepID=A0ABP1DQE6_9APHY
MPQENPPMSTSSGERNIVIIGAGIIGCTAAYYISHHPSFSSNTRVTIIEASKRGVAQGASGKAGGLVAAWAYPEELVSISFPEHERLAEMYDGANRWGFSVMAPAGQTAQVHPYLFTTSMFKFAKEKGVEFIAGKATSLNIDPSSKSVTGVTYIDNESQTEKTIPATQIILAAGVWSPKLIPSLPISGTRAHSITLRFNPPKVFAPHVLFTEITMPIIPSLTSPSSPYSPPSNTVRVASPEIYPRPTNEVYVCGPGDNPPIPETVDDVIVEPRLCENAREQVASISNELREGTIARRQACFLPVVTKGGGPIIGEAETIAKGLIIATGHTCWGISNAPGTGKLLAELVMDGEITSADLKKLAPSKFI